MKDKTKLAQAVTPHKYTEREFADEYQALCKKTGLQIVFEPRWAQSKDNGDYRLIILTSVEPLPKEE